MTDQVLNILKFVLLGLLYVFFARVLWAVWSEVRAPSQAAAGANQRVRDGTPAAAPLPQPQPPRQADRGRATRVSKLVILEPRARRGTTIELSGEVTLGRDANCTIVIDDDTFVSQLHLRMYDYDGQPMIEDLGSTNGTFHNGNKIVGSKLLHSGDRIQVGTTVIEAR